MNIKKSQIPTLPLTSVCLIIAVGFSGTKAYGLPFKNTSKHFESFVNQVWKQGSGNTYRSDAMYFNSSERRLYWGFRNCSWRQGISSTWKESFECTGFVDSVSPMGNTRCEINMSYDYEYVEFDGEGMQLRKDITPVSGWRGKLSENYSRGSQWNSCRPI